MTEIEYRSLCRALDVPETTAEFDLIEHARMLRLGLHRATKEAGEAARIRDAIQVDANKALEARRAAEARALEYIDELNKARAVIQAVTTCTTALAATLGVLE